MRPLVGQVNVRRAKSQVEAFQPGREMAQAQSAGRTEGGITAPLRRRLFRAVWSANLTSNFGWLIQGVGAAWLMTSLDPRPDMVALVQTAIQAPILVLALIAGAAADVWARRNVLMVAQVWVFVTSIVLAVADLARADGSLAAAVVDLLRWAPVPP